MAGLPAAAQGGGGPRLSVVTLDQEALFLQSAFGRRVTRELERDRDALAAENRRIESELIAEERALIDQRAALPASDFAPLADAFDRKVQQIREEQDRKGRALQIQLDRHRQRFLAEIGPVLTDLLSERGAQVLLDRAAVLISVEGIDITGAAIAAIDARLGDGTSANSPLPSPGAELPAGDDGVADPGVARQ
ncbi:OmpH family outer membrane protein [Meridianimarinicoccus roseus]|nr:OmpH family outer membrane protein [Meridianimarinicoccus roseus]